jgi:hypothetical protein
MAKLTALSGSITPWVHGAPTLTIKRALEDAARRLCTECGVLTRTLSVPLVAGEFTYDLALSGGPDEEVVSVRAVELDARPLDPVPLHAIQDNCHGTPWQFAFQPPDYLLVSPVPRDAGTAQVRVTVQPVRNAQEVDEALVRQFSGAVVSAALASLLSQPNEPWHDKNLAGHYLRQAHVYFANAKGKAIFGHSPRGRMVRGPRFAP